MQREEVAQGKRVIEAEEEHHEEAPFEEAVSEIRFKGLQKIYKSFKKIFKGLKLFEKDFKIFTRNFKRVLKYLQGILKGF